MAIAFDSAGTTGVLGTASHTAAAAQTYTHTVVSSGLVTVILAVAIPSGGSTPWATNAPTAVTFGGNTMTLIGQLGNNNITNATGFNALYQYVGTGLNGAKTVSVTCPVAGKWWANTTAWTGVSVISAALTNFGSSITPSTGAVTCLTGQQLVSILGQNSSTAATPLGSPNAANNRASNSVGGAPKTGSSSTGRAGQALKRCPTPAAAQQRGRQSPPCSFLQCPRATTTTRLCNELHSTRGENQRLRHRRRHFRSDRPPKVCRSNE
jgi:hypothetical protein